MYKKECPQMMKFSVIFLKKFSKKLEQKPKQRNFHSRLKKHYLAHT